MRAKQTRFAKRTSAGQGGFSLIELMLALLLTAVLVLAIFTVFNAYDKAVMQQEDLVEIQQMGRSALAKMQSDIMMMGRNVETDWGQEAIIYAAPWEFVFNADTDSGLSHPTTTVAFGGPDTPYTPMTAPGSGGAADWPNLSETIRYYLHDAQTSPLSDERDFSWSTLDRVLRRQSYHAADATGTTVTDDIIAFGVRYDSGSSGYYNIANSDPPLRHLVPLFTYWGDFDFNPSTPDTLWGDSNADGHLSDAEIAALLGGSYSFSYTKPDGTTQTVTASNGGAIYLVGTSTNRETTLDINRNGRIDRNILDSVIHRVELNITTMASKPDPSYHHKREYNFHYREAWVRTAVEPRNLNFKNKSDCGGPPTAPTLNTAAVDQCGAQIKLAWSASSDDGAGSNDVQWYEVMRYSSNPSGGSAVGKFLGLIPATGSSAYAYTDFDMATKSTELSTFYYQIVAVDCGDGRTASGTLSATQTQTAVLAPLDGSLYAFDSPCYTNSSMGSITLVWYKPATEPANGEYWIYRADLGADNGTMVNARTFPIAQVPISSFPTSSVPTTSTLFNALATAAETDPNPTLFTWNGYYVYRDEYGNVGRVGGVQPPRQGNQWSGSERNYYYYEVATYNPSTKCLSTPTTQKAGNPYYPLIESQSFDPASTGLGGSVSRARFSPPTITAVSDITQLDWIPGVATNAGLGVTFNASLDQFCPTAANRPNYYYIYRRKASAWPSNVLDTANNDGVFVDAGLLLVFAGVPITSSGTGSPRTYTFSDTATLYDQNTSGDNTHLGATMTANGQPSGFPTSAGYYPIIYPTLGNQTEDLYSYIVAAVNANISTGAPASPWVFGHSLPSSGGFTCNDSCVALPNAASIFSFQASYYGDAYSAYTPANDSIYVSWYWDVKPPDSSSVTLDYCTAPSSNNCVWYTATTLSPGTWATGTRYYMEHPRSLQTSGQFYRYSLNLTCSNGCSHRVMLGADIIGLEPGPVTIRSSSSAYNKTNTPGNIMNACYYENYFAWNDNLAKPAPTSGTTYPRPLLNQTQKDRLWYRIARYEKWNGESGGLTIYCSGYPQWPTKEWLVRADTTSPGVYYADTDVSTYWNYYTGPVVGKLDPRYYPIYWTGLGAWATNTPWWLTYATRTNPAMLTTNYDYLTRFQVQDWGDYLGGQFWDYVPRKFQSIGGSARQRYYCYTIETRIDTSAAGGTPPRDCWLNDTTRNPNAACSGMEITPAAEIRFEGIIPSGCAY
ncbi:MAG: hypothetical protein GX444_16325 [Myxococcales bacterium]|nr:hypothetical protein [Myxococcales bacterium]